MKTQGLIRLLGMVLAASAVLAQPVTQIRIGTRPEGVKFRVDGVEYQSTQTFLWTQGSKHTVLIFPVQTGTVLGQRLSFAGWYSAGVVVSNDPEAVVTADPAVKDLTATITQEYRLSVMFASCPIPTAPCPSSNGKVTVKGVPYWGEVDIWTAVDESVTIQAEPLPGFVFSGWAGMPPGLERTSTTTLKMDRPRVIRAFFDGSARISLRTFPENMQVLVDRSPQATPADVDWAQGVPKLLGGVSPQRDEFGNMWVFDSWDNGLPRGQNVTFTPALGKNDQQVLTARFAPAAAVTFATEPPGLKLKLDGQDIFDKNYSQIRAIDSDLTIEAPLEQKDSTGRVYTFAGWTNNGTAAQRLLVTRGGLNLTARYRVMPRLIVDSIPSGQNLQVDGRACRTPCTLDRDRDSTVRLSAPAAIPQTDVSRYEFAGWADGGEAERAYVLRADLERVTARYEPAHRISIRSVPEAAGSIAFDPPSPDGFFRTGATVTVTVTGRPGYRFRRWEGDLQGTFVSNIVNVSSSRTATAMFDIVPYTDPNGVQNAAAKTPLPGVAPGSVAAVVGLNLAGSLESSPSSPLAQTLGGVVVRLGLRLLPLFWVSAERIEFQVPSDLEPGSYELTVQRAGQPDGIATMEVVQNNPGLYQRDDVTISGKAPVGVFLRPDGTRAGPGNPARRGEMLTLLATGCGRYDLRMPDGFALPTDMTFRLVDTVDLLAGDQPVTPDFAGGYGSQVGLNAIRFRVPDLPGGAVEIRLRVNGRESNAVTLPIE